MLNVRLLRTSRELILGLGLTIGDTEHELTFMGLWLHRGSLQQGLMGGSWALRFAVQHGCPAGGHLYERRQNKTKSKKQTKQHKKGFSAVFGHTQESCCCSSCWPSRSSPPPRRRYHPWSLRPHTKAAWSWRPAPTRSCQETREGSGEGPRTLGALEQEQERGQKKTKKKRFCKYILVQA